MPRAKLPASRTRPKKQSRDGAAQAKYICAACDMGHDKPVQQCRECGFGAVGEQPDPLDDSAFPEGRRVIGYLGKVYDSEGLNVIRGAVVGLQQKGWRREVVIKADHDGRNYICRFSDVLWEAVRQ